MNRIYLTRLGLLALALILLLTVPVAADETKGTIKNVDAIKSTFILTDPNARDWPMELTKNAQVFINDKEAKLSDLRAGDEVSVTFEKQGEKLMTTTIRAKRK
jgi:Cu/Ag efflux protein CusF